MMEPGRPVRILLVDDSPGDRRLAVEALKEGKVLNRLYTVGDGAEAMAFMRRQGRFADVPRPDLILLDLNLPKKDGREVLAELKGDPDLRRVPVVVMTASTAEEDIVRSYNLHVNCYIQKPLDLGQFLDVVRSIERFWFTIVTLPPEASA